MERTLQTVTSDIAQAIQDGCMQASDGTASRFVTEVQDFNTITVLDDDGREYLVTIEEQ